MDSGVGVERDSKRSDVAAIRTAAQMLAKGVGTLEYANADIFYPSIAELSALDRKPLLKLALATSRHSKVLSLRSVQSARTNPPALSINNPPGHIVDFAVCLESDSTISNAYRTLRPLAANTNKP
ncbi:hypothetical protein AA0117_g13321 [Alternaria alternata]|uniref:Uncharacterized protein n=1 Tax=Alternaria alternata TaxID=5599 RepID=A0A4Q4MNY8_ALTAL|nr:hypothetical protein AA0117_g13321 [Alternaria alternata]